MRRLRAVAPVHADPALFVAVETLAALRRGVDLARRDGTLCVY
ncbi:MAG: hypothetical protein M5T61_12770 [Acidimicrobiia bacterium]|nr:hypothetical protein [Acidimicrobiia bacterium]